MLNEQQFNEIEKIYSDRENYTLIHNGVLQKHNYLTMEERGLLTQMLSHSEGYRFYTTHLAKIHDVSTRKVQKVLKGLEEKGLIIRTRVKEKGKFVSVNYKISDKVGYFNKFKEQPKKEEQSKELATVPSKPKATTKRKKSEYTNDSNYMEIVEAYPRRSSSQGLSKGQAYPLYLHWLKTYSHDEILNSVNNYRIGLENENKIGGTFIKDIKTFLCGK